MAAVDSTSGYLSLAPDLVVEVISPNDSYSEVEKTEVEKKAGQWLEAGCRIVLVADPDNLNLRGYRANREIHDFHTGEVFDAGEVCGGWRLNVDDVFRTR